MGTGFGLGKLEAGTAAHHLDTVLDPGRDHLLDVHDARQPLVQSQHVAAEGHLQVGIFI